MINEYKGNREERCFIIFKSVFYYSKQLWISERFGNNVFKDARDNAIIAADAVGSAIFFSFPFIAHLTGTLASIYVAENWPEEE